MRIYFMFVWRPALTGYSDSGIYFQGAYEDIWSDPIRTVGYSMFLDVLHAITPHLSFVTIVQHILGLLTAVLLFLTVRRVGGPTWLGLVPAAVIALGGDHLFIEHAALSEALFIFLLSAALYSAMRARSEGLAWAAVAGLCLGLGVWVRGAGIALLPVIPLWLLLSHWRPTRRTLSLAAVSLLVGLALVGIYVEWRNSASGLSGLTTNGNWNLYGRVAPWADCTEFDPPQGTQHLCEATPPSERTGGAEQYIYGPQSPAQRAYGPPFRVSPDPDATDELREFSLAAIKGQPSDYLDAVRQDVVRLVDPDRPSYGALSADDLITYLILGNDPASGRNEFVLSWQTLLYPGESEHHGDIEPLRNWEELTRVEGVWMALLLILFLAAPLTVPRAVLSGTLLLMIVTLVLLLFPLVTKSYDYRFVIPALGPLFATGALSAWGLVTLFGPGVSSALSRRSASKRSASKRR
jgi:Dolichyl-phosphate-mannose-protein mannosyltransferase